MLFLALPELLLELGARGDLLSGVGFRKQVSAFGVQGFKLRVKGSRGGVWGVGCGVWGVGCRMQGVECRV